MQGGGAERREREGVCVVHYGMRFGMRFGMRCGMHYGLPYALRHALCALACAWMQSCLSETIVLACMVKAG